MKHPKQINITPEALDSLYMKPKKMVILSTPQGETEFYKLYKTSLLWYRYGGKLNVKI